MFPKILLRTPLLQKFVFREQKFSLPLTHSQKNKFNDVLSSHFQRDYISLRTNTNIPKELMDK